MSSQDGQRPEDGAWIDVFVAAEHDGPCAMRYRGSQDYRWAVFPSLKETRSAASMALAYDIGGYTEVAIFHVDKAPDGRPHFESATDWLIA